MDRRTFFPTAAALAQAALTELRAQTPTAQRKTKHIVLFTSDGVRWQDLFTGIDPTLMREKSAGMADAGALREKLWADTPAARREALMPFFWTELVPQGILLGNASKGSSVEVSNRYRVSYPGYSEILTGRAQDNVITGNLSLQNPTPSFLQFLRSQQHLKREQVAVFASWENFHYSAENKRGDIYVNAGYDVSELPRDSPRTDLFNKLQFDARFKDDSARHDAFTFGLGSEYLQKIQPEHMFISFDETDDWAHSRRYDRVLESLQYVDRALQQLWSYLQSSQKYRGTTTLVVTTDHGRGSTLADFSGHGPRVPGDEHIWAFFIGPDVSPVGEASNTDTYYQRDIAPTILDLLGFDYHTYEGVLGTPMKAVVRGVG